MRLRKVVLIEQLVFQNFQYFSPIFPFCFSKQSQEKQEKQDLFGTFGIFSKRAKYLEGFVRIPMFGNYFLDNMEILKIDRKQIVDFLGKKNLLDKNDP